MKKLLLTGATGLVGNAILRHFHSKGWQIFMATSTKGVSPFDSNIRVIPFALSGVTINAEINTSMSNVDAVVHCASVLPSAINLKNPVLAKRLFFDNITGTFDLIERAAFFDVKNFVFISTANLFKSTVDVVREEEKVSPTNVYMLSKWFGEQILIYFSQNSPGFCALRISAPYGPNYKNKAVIPVFIENAFAGKKLSLLGSGMREQTFTYVRDIAFACENVIEHNVSGVYNIAGPRPVTMKELAETVIQVVGNTDAEMVFSGEPDPNEGVKRRVLFELANKKFGYRPQYDIRDGLEDMVAQIRNPLKPLYFVK